MRISFVALVLLAGCSAGYAPVGHPELSKFGALHRCYSAWYATPTGRAQMWGGVLGGAIGGAVGGLVVGAADPVPTKISPFLHQCMARQGWRHL